MKVFLGLILFAALLSLVTVDSARALGLKVAPLEYKTTLKEAEKKRGVVDVSNPSNETVKVELSVQGFRQINDDGGLQFYDDAKLRTGIKPDLQTLDLGPREAVRLSFLIDGNLLPKGDVFAALFLTTEPAAPQNGVGQVVRVGTLLSIVNKTSGGRAAQVTKLSIPFFHLSDTVTGSYTIKNTENGNSGFYPTVTVSSWPGGKPVKKESTLVFGGRERMNDITYQTGHGLHRVDVSYQNSTRSQWVVSLAPWMLVAAAFIILIISVEVWLLRKRRKARSK